MSSQDRIGVECFDLLWDEILTNYGVGGNLLHIGARASALDHTQRWRRHFPRCQIIGMDLYNGDNVDVIYERKFQNHVRKSMLLRLIVRCATDRHRFGGWLPGIINGDHALIGSIGA